MAKDGFGSRAPVGPSEFLADSRIGGERVGTERHVGWCPSLSFRARGGAGARRSQGSFGTSVPEVKDGCRDLPRSCDQAG